MCSNIDQVVTAVISLQLLSISLLLLAIPFPAYRYAFQSELAILLLGSLAFARLIEPHKQL